MSGSEPTAPDRQRCRHPTPRDESARRPIRCPDRPDLASTPYRNQCTGRPRFWPPRHSGARIPPERVPRSGRITHQVCIAGVTL